MQALAVPTDVGRSADVEHMVRATVERFGRVDVLVNNAGFGFSGTVEETTEADMREGLRDWLDRRHPSVGWPEATIGT